MSAIGWYITTIKLYYIVLMHGINIKISQIYDIFSAIYDYFSDMYAVYVRETNLCLFDE